MRVHPVIAQSGFAALGAAVSGPATHDDLGEPGLMCPELLRLLRQVSDGRHDQGRIHPVAVVLALCAAAVVAGMGSLPAIAGWVADVPGELWPGSTAPQLLTGLRPSSTRHAVAGLGRRAPAGGI